MLKSAEHPLNSEGVWCEVLQRPAGGRPALFLDRDGVIVQEAGYLHRIEEIHVVPGAAKVIAAANKQSIPVIMVTNQSGNRPGPLWLGRIQIGTGRDRGFARDRGRQNRRGLCLRSSSGGGRLSGPSEPSGAQAQSGHALEGRL